MRINRRSAPEPEASHLIVPVQTDLSKLAQVWYADAVWLIDPAQARATQKSSAPTGARFGGQFQAEPQVAKLQLTPSMVVTGPLPEKDAAIWLRKLPEGSDLQAEGEVFHFPEAARDWARAVARRMDGALITADGVEATWSGSVRPDFKLYSPQRLAPEQAVTLIRDALPAAQLAWSDGGEALSNAYAIRHDTPYDGSILVRFDLASGAMPPALKDADWHAVGPNIFHIGWVPSYDTVALVPHNGTGLTQSDVTAQNRAGTWIVRAARILQEKLGGSILDGDGFVVDETALRRMGAISSQAPVPINRETA